MGLRSDSKACDECSIDSEVCCDECLALALKRVMCCTERPHFVAPVEVGGRLASRLASAREEALGRLASVREEALGTCARPPVCCVCACAGLQYAVYVRTQC